jgi:predicted transcriptional regulator
MTIELPNAVESQLKQAARARGISISEYVERLVAETNLRDARIAEFRAAISERMISLRAGERVDGEEVMAHLMDDLPAR